MKSGKNQSVVLSEKKSDDSSEAKLSPTASPDTTFALADMNPLISRIGHMHFILASLLENVRGGFASLIGVSSFQFVLIQLLGVPRETDWTVRSVAREMHMTDAYVSTEIAELVRAGLISKTSNPNDRRVSFLSLTEKGRRSLAAIAPVQETINGALFAWLDETKAAAYAEDLATFVREAEKAIEVLKGTTADHRAAALNEALSIAPTSRKTSLP